MLFFQLDIFFQEFQFRTGREIGIQHSGAKLFYHNSRICRDNLCIKRNAYFLTQGQACQLFPGLCPFQLVFDLAFFTLDGQQIVPGRHFHIHADLCLLQQFVHLPLIVFEQLYLLTNGDVQPVGFVGIGYNVGRFFLLVQQTHFCPNPRRLITGPDLSAGINGLRNGYACQINAFHAQIHAFLDGIFLRCVKGSCHTAHIWQEIGFSQLFLDLCIQAVIICNLQ